MIGKKAGLQSFEQAKNIYLEPQNFMARGILTNTMKIQRHEGRKSYSKEFEAMYAEGMLPAKKEKKEDKWSFQINPYHHYIN